MFCTVAILLGQMRTSHEDIKKIILSVDDSRLSEQMLEQLLKFLPGPEQMNQLHDLKRIFSELSDAEQFGVVVRQHVQCKHMSVCPSEGM